MDELERQILEAHASGDVERLTTLQERYRSEVGRGLRSIIRLGPRPHVVEQPRSKPSGPYAAGSPGTVGLTPSAQRAISAFWRGDGGRETGGTLHGMITGRCVLIDFATEYGDTAHRGSDFIEIDPTEIPYLEDRYGPVIGDWHLHPGQPDPEPSGQDRAAWGVQAGKAGIPWASIVLGDNGTPYWPMRAFITEFRGGKPRTFPAALVIEED